MLAGAAALAIPIVIHLLLKRKRKRLRFSTIQFFLKQDEQSSKRRKLRNWLLLTLRLLIVALLVLAFARPFLQESGGQRADRNRQQVILVLDCSASMQSVGTDGPRWAKAIDQARKIVAGLGSEDRVAVLGCSAHVDVISGFAPPAPALKAIADAEPSLGVSDLGEGLRQAIGLATAVDPKLATTVYVISDLQRSACANLAVCTIPQEIEVKVVAVGDLFSPNFAVSQLCFESAKGPIPQLSVANFSEDENAGVAIDLSVDGKSLAKWPVHLRSGAVTNIELSLPQLKPGWHEVRATLDSKDALELDNTRYASLFIPEPVHVLLVEPRQGKRVFEELCFFIGLALDPSKNSTNSIPTRYSVRKVSLDQFKNYLNSSDGQKGCDWAVLPGLPSIPSGAGKALTEFVQAGGGLLMFLGDEISVNRYASEFRGLLPAQIGALETSPNETSTWRIGDYETNTAVFGAFRLPNSGDLSIPEFTRRHALTLMPGAVPLAFFDDGAPLMVAGTLGRGRVVLMNTAADTSWNDWPKHKTYVPWLHGLGQYLVKNNNGHQIDTPPELVSGDLFDLDLGAATKMKTLRVQSPQNKETLLVADALGRIRDPRISLPGCYSVRDQDGRELTRIAINPPPQESDLGALRPAEFQRRLVTASEPRTPMLSEHLWGHARNQKELWGVLLLSALSLLVVECLLANRTTA